jgi:hypothetical protein
MTNVKWVLENVEDNEFVDDCYIVTYGARIMLSVTRLRSRSLSSSTGRIGSVDGEGIVVESFSSKASACCSKNLTIHLSKRCVSL